MNAKLKKNEKKTKYNKIFIVIKSKNDIADVIFALNQRFYFIKQSYYE
jgi:hypothetical protein